MAAKNGLEPLPKRLTGARATLTLYRNKNELYLPLNRLEGNTGQYYIFSTLLCNSNVEKGKTATYKYKMVDDPDLATGITDLQSAVILFHQSSKNI